MYHLRRHPATFKVMILVIDVGNTAIKMAVMNHEKIETILRCDASNFIASCNELLEEYDTLKDAALCVVGNFPVECKNYLTSHFKLFEVNHTIKLPFKNDYQSNTLGNDRIALVAGALCSITNYEPVLIIDAGTCVTYDYIDELKHYKGGAISPGLRLRYESLHNYTANLPLLEAVKSTEITGNSTANSIHSGILNGLQFEIKGLIKYYRKQNKKLNVFMTGGDAQILSTRLKNRFFATPFLMLHGIYNLYTYNKNL